MYKASKGICHFVTLAGMAKCASHFTVVNLRERAKHTLFLEVGGNRFFEFCRDTEMRFYKVSFFPDQ